MVRFEPEPSTSRPDPPPRAARPLPYPPLDITARLTGEDAGARDRSVAALEAIALELHSIRRLLEARQHASEAVLSGAHDSFIAADRASARVEKSQERAP